MKIFVLYIFIIFFDNLIWILINILPSNYVIKLLKNRPWFYLINLKVSKKIIKKLIKKRSVSSFVFFSSCLSRAIVARIILDICRFPNNLSLGMIKSKDGFKIAHAWVSDPESGYIFTTGLAKDGVEIVSYPYENI